MTRGRLLLAGAASVLVIGAALLLWRPWDGDGSKPGTSGEEMSTGDSDVPSAPVEPDDQLVVTNTDNSGDGSLRAAITTANSSGVSTLITFDSESGVFDDPQVITLESPLPDITGDLEIDGFIEDRLFQATGVTLSGDGEHRVLTVTDGASLTVRSLTIADGAADAGAGIMNDGTLVIEGVTFVDNTAQDAGGGVANQGGTVTVVNSTFTLNEASRGGGIANLSGQTTVVNSTFSENSADDGGGLFSASDLEVSNTILANSRSGDDCVSSGNFDDASTSNLIETNDGCGIPILTDDPVLGRLDYYNGPVMTLPISGGSPAINLGDNEAAVDATGRPLQWDQRGNGDPRFVAGFTDIGAFELQAFPDLVVDTLDDVGLRACTAVGDFDCTLRAAIELANATPQVDLITFDPVVFAERATIRVETDLPEITTDLTIDASDVATITVEGSELRAASGVDLELIDVETP